MQRLAEILPMLRIEIELTAQATTVLLIGRLQSDDCDGLGQTLETAWPCVILNLREVTLVDVAVIRRGDYSLGQGNHRLRAKCVSSAQPLRAGLWPEAGD